MNNLKDILEQETQSIGINASLHPTDTLVTTIHKPAGEANLYVRFRYGQQKNYNHIWGQVSLLMNADLINMNKQVKYQWY